MSSHLVAYADAESREADADARGCHTVAAASVFGGAAPPDAGGEETR